MARLALPAAEKVVSVELDKRLPPVLAETLAGYDNFSLIEGDVMKLDLAAVAAETLSRLEQCTHRLQVMAVLV